jgi:hypothetical protein
VFAILLTSALALGTGLLASATYTDGAMLAYRTAGQLIGWLLLASPLLALGRLQRRLAEMTAAAIAFTTGAAILYVAYFEWGSTPSFPEANAAQLVPVSMPAALAIEQIAVPLPVPAPAPVTPAAQAVLATESHTIPESPPY